MSEQTKPLAEPSSVVIASNVKALSRDFRPGEVVRVSRVYESGCMAVIGCDGAEAYVGDHEVRRVPDAPGSATTGGQP